MAQRYLLLLVIAGFTLGLGAQSTAAPTGRWQTFDEESGAVNSIVEIYKQEGKYFGRIAEIVSGDKNARCTKCSGDQKDQPIKGMVIIKNLTKSGDIWDGGTVFDPQKATEYRFSVWFEKDPNTLFIRGKHWTGLYRTQTWKRE